MVFYFIMSGYLNLRQLNTCLKVTSIIFIKDWNISTLLLGNLRLELIK